MKQIDLLLKTTWDIESGIRYTPLQASEIVHGFINNMNEERVVSSLHRELYPTFFIPNADAKKRIKEIIGITPRTLILSTNAYELEIMRILARLGRQSGFVNEMLCTTRDRLKKSCFGNFCYKGECFETSAVALRFYSTAFPDEKELIFKLICGLNEHFDDRKRTRKFQQYYRKVLSETPVEIAKTNRLSAFFR